MEESDTKVFININNQLMERSTRKIEFSRARSSGATQRDAIWRDDLRDSISPRKHFPRPVEMEARECGNIPGDARAHNALVLRALVGRRRRPPGNPRSQMSEQDYTRLQQDMSAWSDM